MATWRSGYAAACKAVYTGSIPVVALLIMRQPQVAAPRRDALEATTAWNALELPTPGADRPCSAGLIRWVGRRLRV